MGVVACADRIRPRFPASSSSCPIQSFNSSRISTVVVAAITPNLCLSAAPGNVRITKRESGLGKASVINVSQVLTLDRTLLTEQVRRLSEKRMLEIDQGLRVVLGL